MTYLVGGYLCVNNRDGQVRLGGSVHYRIHRLIYEEAHGVLPTDWIVHHVNGDKLDNRLENLAAMPRPEHPTHHRTKSDASQRQCGTCDRWKPLDAFYANQKRCKDCSREARRLWAEHNPDRIASYNARRRKPARV